MIVMLNMVVPWKEFVNSSENKKRKIFIATRSLERGGTEIHLLRALPRLNRNLFTIKVYCFEHPGELASEMEKAGIEVVGPVFSSRIKRIPLIVKPLAALISMLQFIVLLYWCNPQVVHFYLPAAYLLLGPVSLLHPFSAKIMSRRSLNHYQDKYPDIVRYLEKALHRRMDRILANSTPVFEQLRDVEKVSSDKLQLIYNGVDLAEFQISQDLTEELFSIPDDCLSIAVVANLISYKGHEDLIEACAILREDWPELPDWKVLLIGNDTGHLKEKLESLSIGRNVTSHVCFLGKRNDVAAILSRCDIGILPSHEEGFSNAVLECMAAGLPMIVTNVGGNPEAVLHDETGFVVPPRSPERLVNAMAKLLSDQALRKRFGQAGEKRVEKLFTNQGSIDAYEKLYLTLAS